MNSPKFLAAIVSLAFLLPAAAPGDALTLKEIMQGLRNDLVKITDGLLVDDFALISEGARGIAEHPSIPANQVKLVAAELGSEMPAFKQLDTEVHKLSLAIDSAANAADLQAVYQSYQAMSEGCLACHAAYKERVARALTPTATP